MYLLKNFLIGFSVFFLSLGFAFSQEAINDTYIILFQKDAGLIDPPNPENAGRVPMGQPTSGQSKEELAAELGLLGEIVAILEVNNGIVVRMNAQEAQKWRDDGRVQSIEQDSRMVTFDSALNDQNDYPVYRNNTLILPRVDTDEQAGIFQEGVFQFDSSINAWRLQEYQVLPVSDIFLVESNKVELIVSEALPTQVFLKVNGSFADSCQKLGKINHRLQDSHFEVVISISNTIPSDGSQGCFPVVTPFEKVIPLPVYGLSAGTYTYVVNGKMTGSFELKSDNHL